MYYDNTNKWIAVTKINNLACVKKHLLNLEGYNQTFECCKLTFIYALVKM